MNGMPLKPAQLPCFSLPRHVGIPPPPLMSQFACALMPRFCILKQCSPSCLCPSSPTPSPPSTPCKHVQQGPTTGQVPGLLRLYTDAAILHTQAVLSSSGLFLQFLLLPLPVLANMFNKGLLPAKSRAYYAIMTSPDVKAVGGGGGLLRQLLRVARRVHFHAQEDAQEDQVYRTPLSGTPPPSAWTDAPRSREYCPALSWLLTCPVLVLFLL